MKTGAGSTLLFDVEGQRFYFVYSYAATNGPATPFDDGCIIPPLVSWAKHGDLRLVATVENGPLCGAQFHPEKSDEAGLALLKNWLFSL